MDRPRLLLILLVLAVATISSPSFVLEASAGESGTTPTPTASPSPTEQSADESAQTSLTGTLTTDDEPIEGVTLVARGPDGSKVGEATSGRDGKWEVVVPGPGRYEVELVVETLPEDVELRDERNTRSITILSEGSSRRVIFSFGESADVGRQFRRFLQLFANGIRFGLIIAMAAIGLSLIFGTTGLINFAHGDIVTFGAIIAWFWSSGPGIDIHLIPAALVAIAITAGFSGGLEVGLFRPLRKRKVGLFQLLIITIGLSLVIRHILLIFFGGSPRPYTDYTIS
ncbi:MAG: branched-chain amino acid ABC transporter permease, partial [Actinobacteria bacterium]|nr:branched-chain amino acid ABC transporter permease [Actinomycetota bacterium]